VITYSIDTSVGPLGRGIPSEGVAVTIALDALLYANDDDDAWRRQAVDVERYTDDSGDVVAIRRDGRELVRVNIEHRCDHCGSRLPWEPWGIR
jgi:hypothetical protein